MTTAFVMPNDDSRYSPNDIYTILFNSIGKEALSQPTSNLIFGDPTSKVEKIVQNEFPLPLNRVARGKIENYRYTQAYYDTFWMVYHTGNGGEWDERLFEVSFSQKLKNQQIQEKETNVFLKINQMYGDYTTVSKFIYEEGKFDPKIILGKMKTTASTEFCNID